MSDVMHIGITALMAYQSAINVASQNIANADTPFYSRRQIDFKENIFTSGVSVADVKRIFDETANRYVQMSNSDFSKWDIYFNQIGNFEPLLDDDKTSISKFITDSLGALRQIDNSFSASNRSLYMGKLISLAQQFQNVNSEINRQIANVNSSLQTEVQQVNDILGNIANINDKISAIGGEARPELLDQREALVQQLSSYINFSRNLDQNGRLDITLTNGLSLLSGNPPATFTTMQDPANPNNLLIGVNVGGGNMDVTNIIQGGEISGWMNYRQNIETTQIALGRLALVIGQSLNAQNQLGIDANGDLGGNIFNDINSSGAINSRAIANANNIGSSTMTVNINNVSQLQASDYRLTIGNSNNYVLTRISDNTIVSSGSLTGTFPQSISADGFTMNLNSGTFASGDQYLISPTNGAANNISLAINDPSQLAFGWPITASEGIKQSGSDGTILVKSINDTTNSSFSIPKQLNPPIKIQFSVSGGVTQYSLYNANTNTLMEGPISYTNGSDIFPTPGGYDPGYRVSISGKNIQDGDTFNIQYNSNATGDNRNAVAMSQVYQAGTVLGTNGRMVSFVEGYNLLSSDISVKTNDAKSRYATTFEILNKAQARRESISGVALEEETLNLAQFQAAYQASAQVIQVAKSIFDVIASMIRA